MLHKNHENKTEQIQMVSLEQLVPINHILRKISKTISFNFIYELVEDKYCLDNGRPSIDPVVLMKLVFLQYLFGIKSMRQTIREVEVNMAYRWFLGLDFYDSVPHFTTFSQNYRRRFKDTNLFQEIFDNILMQAYEQGFVDTQLQFVDSTHVKAHANRYKNKKVKIGSKAKSYQQKLDKEIQEDRKENNKKDLKPPKGGLPEEKEVTQSTTDPESGLFHKGEHKEVFAYSIQTSCDKNGWILAFDSYPGNLHDSTTFFSFYESKIKKYKSEKIVMDAGYKNPAIAKTLLDDNTLPVFPYTAPKRPKKSKDDYNKNDFVYDEYYNCYLCPENQVLKYSTTDREGYRHYKSDPKICSRCANLKRCTRNEMKQRTITRHIWQDYLDVSEEYRYTYQGKGEYKLRKETIERQFGSAKEYHGFRYTNMRWLMKMQMKAALTFTCLNMKKLAIMMDKKGKKEPRNPSSPIQTNNLMYKIMKFHNMVKKSSNPRLLIWGLSTL